MPSYFATTSDADAIAATLPASSIPNYLGASSGVKGAALEDASDDLDVAMRYQGRKFDMTQPNEFPRTAFESDDRLRFIQIPGAAVSFPPRPGDEVWDWDPVNLVAVVPPKVLRAVIYQADANLDGSRNERLDKQHDGVVYDQTGGLAESYKSSDRPGLTTGLCRKSFQLMRRYELTSGSIL